MIINIGISFQVSYIKSILYKTKSIKLKNEVLFHVLRRTKNCKYYLQILHNCRNRNISKCNVVSIKY